MTLLTQTALIAAAYATNHTLTVPELAGLIGSVHSTLSRIEKDAATPHERQPAACSIADSVTKDYIVCLTCGRKAKMLKRHLMAKHGQVPAQYRAFWGLRYDYPIVAPRFARKRAQIAKQVGLGQHVRHAR